MLQQLLAAAPPALQLDVSYVYGGSCADSLPLLCAAQPNGPLHMINLSVDCSKDLSEGIGTVVGARRFGAAIAHAWVRCLMLEFFDCDEPAAREALADGLLARTCRVESLSLSGNGDMTAAYLPALARLLAAREGEALESVNVSGYDSLFAGASPADVETVCASLRRSTLTEVYFYDVGLTEHHIAALRRATAGGPRLLFESSDPHE